MSLQGLTPLMLAAQAGNVPLIEALLQRLLAPPSFDVQVDGHLLQIGREQGEYIVFQVMLERLWQSKATVKLRLLGIGTAELMTYVDWLPEVVIRGYRRKRPYLSAMLSKNESLSRTKGSRRLFERRAHGLYVFNPGLSVWVDKGGGEGAWAPIDSVLGMPIRLAPVKFIASRQR